jgi:hypothetical protein
MQKALSFPRRAAFGTLCAVGLVTVTACAGAPRPYLPMLAHPPSDVADFEAAYEACRVETAEGDEDRMLVTAGLATGGGVLASYGGGATALALVGLTSTSATTIFSAAAAGMLVGAPIGVYMVSAAQRDHVERTTQEAMQKCLAARGYEVTGWQLLNRARALADAAG